MSTAPALVLARQMAADGTARQLRRAAGLSLYDLARDLGVRASSISRWERGERSPRGEVAIRYGQLLAELAELVRAL